MKHLRRPSIRPEDDGWWMIRCDCGWEGRTPCMTQGRDDIATALEHEFKLHLPPDEARTHLLVDARQPDAFQSLEELTEQLGDGKSAWAAFNAQPKIIGTFVMPIGEPVVLVADRVEDDVHFGSYRTHEGETGELPIGEVKTPEGRVFRLAQ